MGEVGGVGVNGSEVAAGLLGDDSCPAPIAITRKRQIVSKSREWLARSN